jgi:UTP--glucose-1-phosphate uridylyltransferase
MERERVFGCLLEGQRFDCGSKLGYLEAQLAFARKEPDLWHALRLRFDDRDAAMLARRVPAPHRAAPDVLPMPLLADN